MSHPHAMTSKNSALLLRAADRSLGSWPKAAYPSYSMGSKFVAWQREAEKGSDGVCVCVCVRDPMRSRR